MAEERSVSDIVQDILGNLQDMLRSEVHLLKVEMRGEVRQAVSSGAWTAAGGVAAMSAWIFLLWTLAYALATRIPMWAATLVVSLMMAAAAAALILNGIRKAKRVHPIPGRTVESVKENIAWMIK